MDFWGAGGGRNRISEFGRDEKFLKSVRRWNKRPGRQNIGSDREHYIY